MTENNEALTMMDRMWQQAQHLRTEGSPVAATRLERLAVDVSSLEGPDRAGISRLLKAHETILDVTCPSEKVAFIEATRTVMSEAFPTLGHVSAEAHSDDHHVEVNFNAAPWFQTATDEAIIALAECGWSGDYPADAVANWFHDTETSKLFDYIDTNPTMSFTNDTVGFECRVDEKEARAWIAEYRPALLTRLPEGDEHAVGQLALTLKNVTHSQQQDCDMTQSNDNPLGLVDRLQQEAGILRDTGATNASTCMNRLADDVSSFKKPDRETVFKLLRAHGTTLQLTGYWETKGFFRRANEVIDEVFPVLGEVSAKATLEGIDDVDTYFNAAPWLRTASDEKVIELAEAGWGGPSAVTVAEAVQDSQTYELVDFTKRFGLEFRCGVNAQEAHAWIAEYRPELLDRLPAVNDITYRSASP